MKPVANDIHSLAPPPEGHRAKFALSPPRSQSVLLQTTAVLNAKKVLPLLCSGAERPRFLKCRSAFDASSPPLGASSSADKDVELQLGRKLQSTLETHLPGSFSPPGSFKQGESLFYPPPEFALPPGLHITSVESKALSVPLISPFSIATSTITHAENVAVRVTLSDGSQGFGETPVLPGVTVLDQQEALHVLRNRVAPWLVSRASSAASNGSAGQGNPSSPFWDMVHQLRLLEAQLIPGHNFAAVRAGVEMAVLDAVCRSARVPLWSLFGCQRHTVETDITIPLSTVGEAFALADQYRKEGFSFIKLKTGLKMSWKATPEQLLPLHAQGLDWNGEEGTPLALAAGAVREALVAEDCARVAAVFAAHPQCTLLLDGNEGYSEAEASELVRRLRGAWEMTGCMPAYLEQPLARADTGAMLRLTQHEDRAAAVMPSSGHDLCKPRLKLVSDEGCRSAAEAAAVVAEGSAHMVNIKLAKLGVLGALDAIAAVKSSWQTSGRPAGGHGGGVGLMIGGMVETRVGMGFAAHLAAGLGFFSVTDVDTPLLLKEDPVAGGYHMQGPRVVIPDDPGTGCTLDW